ncbi:putative cationic amino acid transporter [Trypanosoma rangeli]|uniref:Putative cationic amino acid transporter n=1 Tax=Trypanosoma rangeli TaxID=5698 RepID=A0A3R7P1S5_TRYRA|nr:putative cationic amino acid transporter [Trypanosoma rangeli]RNF11346.1 putative cationic amino acid transporter [Trypanosoma rangeli]|eukprot:RNF11346.1 putative cationic amino acid transporter [Trypanosoma rangeli]
MFSHIDARCQPPVSAKILCGVVGAVISGLFSLEVLDELISFGTLMFFSCVCVSMWKIQVDFPGFPRPFVGPPFPFVPFLRVMPNCLQFFFFSATGDLPQQTSL